MSENKSSEILNKFENLLIMISDYYKNDKAETDKRLIDLDNKIESDRRAIDEKFTLLCEKLEKKVGGTWP